VTTSGFDVFGTGVRTKTLLAIYLMQETHASELSRLLDAGVNTIRNALDTLERAGLVVGTMEGQTRRVRLNPKFRAHAELAVLLHKLSLGEIALMSKIADLRRRPRRLGKAL
jgi:predicted transcriptional regulator